MAKCFKIGTKVENASQAGPYVNSLNYCMHDRNLHFVYVSEVSRATHGICEHSMFVFNDDAVAENVGYLS